MRTRSRKHVRLEVGPGLLVQALKRPRLILPSLALSLRANRPLALESSDSWIANIDLAGFRLAGGCCLKLKEAKFALQQCSVKLISSCTATLEIDHDIYIPFFFRWNHQSKAVAVDA